MQLVQEERDRVARVHRRVAEKIGDPVQVLLVQVCPVGGGVGIDVMAAVGLKLGDFHRGPADRAGLVLPVAGQALEAGHVHAAQQPGSVRLRGRAGLCGDGCPGDIRFCAGHRRWRGRNGRKGSQRRRRGWVRGFLNARLARVAVPVGQPAEPGPQRPAVLHERDFTRLWDSHSRAPAKGNGRASPAETGPAVTRPARTAAPGARPTSRAGTPRPSSSPRPAARRGGRAPRSSAR